ncbi:MAG: hypothetical protein J3K34DRAFT_520225 [Monoraphidium minutum]|nr:MAG: hypothetical protein J3K34DRAFT_520225 [Monoraphidium minutum]
MGCKVSRHVNPIDAALTQALHAAKARRGKKDFTFNELLLKFSSMSAGFKKAREYFDSMDLNGDKLIDLHEFTTMAPRVGLDMALEDLKNVFAAADIDNSTKARPAARAAIDVFEFMLVFVVIQLLSPERARHLPPEIHKTLEIVEDAFCCFDASEDGYLEPSEVAEVLCTSNTPGRATRALSDKLFAQLDFDGSGGISFKEFLIGLEKMVMEEFVDVDVDDGDGAGGGGGGLSAAEEEEDRRLMEQAKRLAAQQRGAAAAGGGARRGGGGGGGSVSHQSSGVGARHTSGDGARRSSVDKSSAGGHHHRH